MGFAHFWLSGFDQIRVSFWAYFFVGLQNGALYAMIAVGYTLVYGVLGLINFAHGDVFMWGGFGAAFLTRGILGAILAIPTGSLISRGPIQAAPALRRATHRRSSPRSGAAAYP